MCSPVWSVVKKSEPAAFNAMLSPALSTQPLVMHAGDTITVPVVSDYGGKAEVNQYCGAANYGAPYCIYPWYTLGSSGFHYGVDFPDTVKDYGKADQFQQTTQCGGPFGADSTYCATILH